MLLTFPLNRLKGRLLIQHTTCKYVIVKISLVKLPPKNYVYIPVPSFEQISTKHGGTWAKEVLSLKDPSNAPFTTS